MKSFIPKVAGILLIGFSSISAKAQKVPEMITVVGDTFKMGTEPTQESIDEKNHKVIISTFKIAKTEVTVQQWKHYCEATATPMPADPGWGWIDDNPIVDITWDDAVAYCNWLSAETGKKFRLPTEAEWEFAARGGVHTKDYKFSGGRGIELTGWSNVNSAGHTHKVAAKRANELGLYDMSGNVYEWCGDRYGNYPGKTMINPKGATTGNLRVYRGGSWYSPEEYCASSARDSNDPKSHFNFVGFRPVEEVEAIQPGAATQLMVTQVH